MESLQPKNTALVFFGGAFSFVILVEQVRVLQRRQNPNVALGEAKQQELMIMALGIQNTSKTLLMPKPW